MKTKSIVLMALGLVMIATPALGALGDLGNGVPDVQPRQAVPLNGGWQYWSWGGSTVPGNPFTYTAAAPTWVRVTDAYCYGDRFSVTITSGGISGNTRVPGASTCGGPTNGAAAYADPRMSSGCFLALPGAPVSIRIGILTNPFGGGGAFIRADDIPFEPADCINRILSQ